jgi:hypothetical protein
MALPAGLARRDGANTGHNVGVSEADWGNLASRRPAPEAVGYLERASVGRRLSTTFARMA